MAHYRVDHIFKGKVTENYSIKASLWLKPFVGSTYIMFIDSLDEPLFDSPFFAAGCRNSVIANLDFDYMAQLGEGYEPLSGGEKN